MLEANALGVPIIGYNKGNISDYIKDGINGYKFNRTTEIPNLMKKIKKINFQKCIELAKEYNINSVAEKYTRLYKSIISDNII